MRNLSLKQHLLFLGILSIILAAPLISVAQVADSQFVNGDPLPDAPELAKRGEYKIGVRTTEIIHKDQLDILNSKEGNEVRYDRKLKLEIWYPAIIPQGQKDLITYVETRGVKDDPKKPYIEYSFSGRALRDASPVTTDGQFPLIIVSHGYVGSRLLLSYLTENLASKGYVVVSIDHMESTYNDAGGFQSTLLNRSSDILFVLDQVAEMTKPGNNYFLSGLVDASNTGLIGYSMGGYGVLNAAGAGYSPQIIKMFGALAGGSKAIEILTAGNPEYLKRHDDRIKAVVAFAPWGMERGAWDTESLKGLKVPVFFVAGSQDDVSGYEKGIKAIFTGAVNSDRYLLTYVNARHNVAPNAPPAESLNPGLPFDFYYHYAEPAWDQKRINNINQHFVTAFLGIQLGKKDYGKYIDAVQLAGMKNWTGFKPRTSVGLELLHLLPGKE
jgi:predicted dienelactone hydrolase